MTTYQTPPLSVSEQIRAGAIAEAPPSTPRRRFRRSSGPKEPLPPTRLALVVAVGTIGLMAVWFLLYALYFSGLQEGHDQHVLYTRLRPSLAGATVPIGGLITPGRPVAYLTMPGIGLHAVVVEGTSSKELAEGPGHYPSSPLPGQAGISQIFGRSATFGSPFAKIGSLRVGAPIDVTTGQGAFIYKVLDVRRAGDPIPGVLATNPSSLTLVTSTGSGWRGGWAPSRILYVDASLASGKVQPTPSGRPSTVAPVEEALAGDTQNLVPLVLWLSALALLGAGFVYAHPKWTTWQLWLVALPAGLAVLWGATSSVLLLLPNLA